MKIKYLIAKLESCENREILNDVSKLLELLKNSAKVMNSTVMSEHVYKFSPYGVSINLIVGESHIAVHTWPEYDSAYFVVTICNENSRIKDGLELINKYLKPRKISLRYGEI